MELLFENIEQQVSLSDKDKKNLSETFRTKKVKRKQFLLEAGDVCRNEYFITKGCLRSYFTDKDGFENIISFAVEGWWMSDLASLHTGNPSVFSIDALEDTEVLFADKNSLDKILIQIPQLEKHFRILMQNAYIAQLQRIVGLNSFTAEERYMAFQKKYPQFDRRIPQKYLASFLGMTPEFLSKLKKQLLRN